MVITRALMQARRVRIFAFDFFRLGTAIFHLNLVQTTQRTPVPRLERLTPALLPVQVHATPGTQSAARFLT